MDDVQPDITDCAAEPIRIPGGIQAHGALLVIAPESLKILQASANAERLLGFKPAPGATIHAIPGSDTDPLVSEVARWLRMCSTACARLILEAARFTTTIPSSWESAAT